MTKTERWLNLIAFLLNRRYAVAREELLSQVSDYSDDWHSGSETRRESARRKFERDKRELRELGVVLETHKVAAEHTDQEVEGYLLKPSDFYLPYVEVRGPNTPRGKPYFLPSIRLEPDELPILRRAAERVAQLEGTALGVAAESVVRKLSFDLPDLTLSGAEQTLLEPTSPTFERQFAVVKQGLEQQRAVRCRYYAIGRDTEETRTIEPYGLMLTWGIWYTVAHSRERRALRVFRIDRMKDAELVAGPDGEFDVPRGFTIAPYLNRAPWEFSDDKPVPVRVRIAFPQSRWVVGEGLGKVTRAVTEDGSVELEFAVRATDPFIRWLLPFGPQIEVLSPASLKKRLAEARAALRRIYR
jgi:predicted DNA-binding transcriptional regulator YafY